jgi:hypothetical protein
MNLSDEESLIFFASLQMTTGLDHGAEISP